MQSNVHAVAISAERPTFHSTLHTQTHSVATPDDCRHAVILCPDTVCHPYSFFFFCRCVQESSWWFQTLECGITICDITQYWNHITAFALTLSCILKTERKTALRTEPHTYLYILCCVFFKSIWIFREDPIQKSKLLDSRHCLLLKAAERSSAETITVPWDLKGWFGMRGFCQCGPSFFAVIDLIEK